MVKKRVLYSVGYNLSIADMVNLSIILISEIGVLRLNSNLQEDYQQQHSWILPHYNHISLYSVNQKLVASSPLFQNGWLRPGWKLLLLNGKYVSKPPTTTTAAY